MPLLENLADLARPHFLDLVLDLFQAERLLFIMGSLDLLKHVLQHLIFVLGGELLSEYLFADVQDSWKLLFLLRRNPDLDPIGNTMTLLADLIHYILELLVGFFGGFVRAYQLSVQV